MDPKRLRKLVKRVKDFPVKGVLFRDITPLLADETMFHFCIETMAGMLRDENIDKVVSIESRGFIFGSALAYRLHCGFVPIRKAGKLPRKTLAQSYELEYDKHVIEIHQDAIKKNEKVVIVDDVLATGGTLEAAGKLVKELGGKIFMGICLIELVKLNGREKVDFPIAVMMRY